MGKAKNAFIKVGESSARTMVGLSRVAALAGRLSLTPVIIGLELPNNLPGRMSFEDRLRRNRPLHEARRAQAEVEHGLTRNDGELVSLGHAAMTKAILRANDDPHVPSHIAARTAQAAIDTGLNPSDVDIVAPEVRQRANEILRFHAARSDWE